jgi:hypothetical protein
MNFGLEPSSNRRYRFWLITWKGKAVDRALSLAAAKKRIRDWWRTGVIG